MDSRHIFSCFYFDNYFIVYKYVKTHWITKFKILICNWYMNLRQCWNFTES